MGYLSEAREYLESQTSSDLRSFGSRMVARELKAIRADRAGRINALLMQFKNDGQLRILDIGCGIGDIALGLGSRGHVVVGVDTDREAIAVAQVGRLETGYANVEFQGDYEAVRGKEFDVVVCNHVIEHSAEPRRLLVDMHRFLRADGILFLSTPNRYWPFDPHSGRLFGSWSDKRLFTWSGLQRVLSDTGYRVKNMTPFVMRHLDSLYGGAEHHTFVEFWLARHVGRLLPESFVNILTQAFFAVAQKAL